MLGKLKRTSLVLDVYNENKIKISTQIFNERAAKIEYDETEDKLF